MLRGHRANPDRGPGSSPEPTLADVRIILAETPRTMFLTITRRAAAVLNALAVRALFHEQPPRIDTLTRFTIPDDSERPAARLDRENLEPAIVS